MKYLSILRHAKAEHTEEYPTDAERPLTKRGTKDAHEVGEFLIDIEPPVDWIVSSPSLRTRQTTTAVTTAIKYKRAVVWQEAVYLAEAENLLTILTQIPVEMEHVLITGHNPGMEELVSGLCAGSPSRLGIRMPTGGLAHLTLEIFGWNQTRWGCGTLHWLVRPKLIRNK
jgi:phosphohistidine phosphatase